MQVDSEKELELIRKEMTDVKDCINKYVGYVFAGSGAAIYGIARMEKPGTVLTTEMAIVSFALSIIISFVVLILFYKFYSHNRFAGYCKLLNHERYDIPEIYKNISFFSWELALGRLRYLDMNPAEWSKTIESVDIEHINKDRLKEYLKNNILASKNWIYKCTKGSIILIKALLGKIETGSWAFPPLVTSICFVFSLFFLLIGCYSIRSVCCYSMPLQLIILIVALFQIILWIRLICKLYDIMSGSSTIESFFYKFMPIRAIFLNSYNIIPRYLDT